MKKSANVSKITAILCLALALLTVLSIVSGAAFDNTTDSDVDDIKPMSNKYYLPPYVDLTALEMNITASEYTVGDKTYAYNGDPIDVTEGKTTDKYGNVCYSVSFKNGKYSSGYTFYQLSSIPSVYVKTSEGINNINKNKNLRDKNTTVLIIDENGETVYSDEKNETVSEIKGRGNATWGYAKKPYQIKLGKKADLFGMGKSKTWILLANYMDESFLRNAVAFRLSDELGLDFSPKSTFVNLYVDNTFAGLYQLCEKTQIGSNRIEITDLEELNEKANDGVDLDTLPVRTESSTLSNLTEFTYVSGMKNPADITGGYLIELDNIRGRAEKCRFTTKNNNIYVLKSPECASREQVLYIATLVSEMEEAIYSSNGINSKGKHYSEYADVDSLVAMYMSYEMTKNWDAYVGSTFFYKDADTDGKTSKIYAGPAWDFDHSYGNLHRMTYSTDKTELWAAGTKRSDYCRFFGAKLIAHEELGTKLAEYATLAADKVTEMLAEGGFIDRMSDKLADTVAADKILWGHMRGRDFEEWEVYKSGDDQSAIGFLTDFMRVRAAGIYEYFVGEEYVPPVIAATTEATTEATTTAELTTAEQTTAEPTTASATEATAAPTTEATEASTTSAPPAKSGCASALSSALVIPASLGVLIFVKKKKDEHR
ncbi:MAG: CotH kinase family protein [Clostridia bacterium]|nr:CotH kinase family protein [Clostridia bacterium]